MPRKSKPLARGWDRTFDDPIPLPDGRELRTLRDAGNYIAKLPKAEHDAPEWETAIRALMLVVEHGGDIMLPRIGIMRALRRHGQPEPTPRKKRAKKNRIIRYDGRCVVPFGAMKRHAQRFALTSVRVAWTADSRSNVDFRTVARLRFF